MPIIKEETANTGAPLNTIVKMRKRAKGSMVSTIGAAIPPTRRFLPLARSLAVTFFFDSNSIILFDLLYKHSQLNSN